MNDKSKAILFLAIATWLVITTGGSYLTLKTDNLELRLTAIEKTLTEQEKPSMDSHPETSPTDLSLKAKLARIKQIGEQQDALSAESIQLKKDVGIW